MGAGLAIDASPVPVLSAYLLCLEINPTCVTVKNTGVKWFPPCP